MSAKARISFVLATGACHCLTFALGISALPALAAPPFYSYQPTPGGPVEPAPAADGPLATAQPGGFEILPSAPANPDENLAARPSPYAAVHASAPAVMPPDKVLAVASPAKPGPAVRDIAAEPPDFAPATVAPRKTNPVAASATTPAPTVTAAVEKMPRVRFGMGEETVKPMDAADAQNFLASGATVAKKPEIAKAEAPVPAAKQKILAVAEEPVPAPVVRVGMAAAPAPVLASDEQEEVPVPSPDVKVKQVVAAAPVSKASEIVAKEQAMPSAASAKTFAVAETTLPPAPKQQKNLDADDVPAPVLAVKTTTIVAANLPKIQTHVDAVSPATAAPAIAASEAATSAAIDAARAGETNRIILATGNELASLALVSQTSAAKTGAAAMQAGETELASNTASAGLATLSPASGGLTPGGPAAPIVTLAPLPQLGAPFVPAATDISPELPPPPAPSKLSPQSKAIADTLPPEVRKNTHAKTPVDIQHFQKNPLEDENVRQHEGVGISISIRTPKTNVSHMLEEAYGALIAGNQEDAVNEYKQVLELEPDNTMALFGLATTYHRAGQIKLARPLYGKLLKLDPRNEQGLTNFLVLLSDESPSEALSEMRRLQESHPDFSPLPAQMAVVYERLGDRENAVRSMKHAIDLSPENIKYRYDMAVILDKAGDWQNAATYYQQLITASDRGDKIPARPEEIQERLTFIRSNRPVVTAVQSDTASPGMGVEVKKDSTGSTNLTR